MADEIDRANDRAEADLARAIESNRAEIKPGEPGECALCGKWSGRLINGVCARCRDARGLP